MMKILIIYINEDLNAANEAVEIISKFKNVSVVYELIDEFSDISTFFSKIKEFDATLFIFTSISIRSEKFKLAVRNALSFSRNLFSFSYLIDNNDFTDENSYFLSIPKFSKLLNVLRLKYDRVEEKNLDRPKNTTKKKLRHPTRSRLKKAFDNIGKSREELSLKRKRYCMISVRKKRDVVNFSIFAPCQISVGSSFAMDLWAYLESQYDTVLKKVEEIKREHLVGRQNSVFIERKSVLTVRLEIKTLNVKTKFNRLYWNGKAASTSFLVEVPENANTGDHFGISKIYFQKICIASIIFTINVTELKQDFHYKDTKEKIKKYKTAFASYSSKDDIEVYSRIHGMTKIAPDLKIFLARYSLKSKERWEEALMEHLPSKDVFYLFWSRNALKSTWVDKEWRLALKERDLSYIDPVPLESPKLATPPPELSALHFDDIWIALKHENDYLDSYPR